MLVRLSTPSSIVNRGFRANIRSARLSGSTSQRPGGFEEIKLFLGCWTCLVDAFLRSIARAWSGSNSAAEQPAHWAFLGFGCSSESRLGLRSCLGGQLGANSTRTCGSTVVAPARTSRVRARSQWESDATGGTVRLARVTMPLRTRRIGSSCGPGRDHISCCAGHNYQTWARKQYRRAESREDAVHGIGRWLAVWSPRLAPQRARPPCSSVSPLLWRSVASHDRASPASRVGSRRGPGFEWCRRFLDPP